MTRKTLTDPIEILNGHPIFTLHEICERCGVRVEVIVELVEYGIIAPIKEADANEWIFDALALARLTRALRMQHDLEINLPGIAVSLDLLDEIERLRQQVDFLDGQLRQLIGD